MDIKIPKTLAEPLTIPWLDIAMVTNSITVDSIKAAIREYFMMIVMTNKEPPRAPDGRTRLTPGGLLYMLQYIAEQAGAVNVYGKISRNMEGTKHIGDMYYVFFMVPGSKTIHFKVLFTWFSKS